MPEAQIIGLLGQAEAGIAAKLRAARVGAGRTAAFDPKLTLPHLAATTGTASKPTHCRKASTRAAPWPSAS